MVEPIITAAIITALASAANSFFGGKNKPSQVSTQTQKQKGIQNNLLDQANQMQGPGGGYQNALGLLQSLLNPNSSAYQDFETPYLNQFNEQTLPGIAERFAGAGALNSSGFGQALGGAASGLQSNLANLKANLRQNAMGTLVNQYNSLVGSGLGNPQFANVYQDKGAGFLPSFANGMSSAAPYFAEYFKNQQSKTPSPYETQFPLTNYYDQNFRAAGVY